MAESGCWMVRKHGLLETSVGLDAAGIRRSGLGRVGSVLPVASVPAPVAKLLGLHDRLEELSEEQWSAALELVRDADDDAIIGNLYAAAARSVALRPQRFDVASGPYTTPDLPRR